MTWRHPSTGVTREGGILLSLHAMFGKNVSSVIGSKTTNRTTRHAARGAVVVILHPIFNCFSPQKMHRNALVTLWRILDLELIRFVLATTPITLSSLPKDGSIKSSTRLRPSSRAQQQWACEAKLMLFF